MPISVPGSKRRAQRASGFTLIELLVVVALVAIATAAVSLAIPDGARSQLEREGERLSALLESARAEARTQGLSVSWRPVPGEDGSAQFRFEGLPSKNNLPENWLNDAPGVVLDKGAKVLSLGPEPLLPAQGVTLTLNDAKVRVSSDGLSAFAVERGAPPQ